MNAIARSKVANLARKHGFVVQTKSGDRDRYYKNLMLQHSGIHQTIYVSKVSGIDAHGNAMSYTVTVHPDFYRPDFLGSALGIEQKSNRRVGGSLFSSSNYRGFPNYPGFGEPCGVHLEALNADSLDQLFGLFAGKQATVLPEYEIEESGVMRVQSQSAAKQGLETEASVNGKLSALIIRSEPIEQILRGENDWEMRLRVVHKRGRIALVKKGSGQVVGVAKLVDCIGPLTEQEMLGNYQRHRIPSDRLKSGEIAKWRTAWVLEDVHRLPKPVPYTRASGAVAWVSLGEQVSRQVLQQVPHGYGLECPL